MENKLVEIIYDKIKDTNFYNYANDEELKNIGIALRKLFDENMIDIILEHRTYTLRIHCSYADGSVE
jgi:hypothetical protein